MSNRRAVTLVEVLIASGLALLLVGVVLAVFMVLSKVSRKAEGGYLLNAEVAQGTRWLRNDLFDCSLASIRVFPNEEHESGPASLSLLAAHPYDDHLNFQITKYGTPDWQKRVFYMLEKDPEREGEGQLIRWEQKLETKGSFPTALETPPFTLNPESAPTRRVALRHLVSPNWQVSEDGKLSPLVGAQGGFETSFVRRTDKDGEYAKVTRNPTNWFDTKDRNVTQYNTGLVEVRLVFAQKNRVDKLDSEEFVFRVHPRN